MIRTLLLLIAGTGAVQAVEGGLVCTEPGALNYTLEASDIETLRLNTGTGIIRLRGSEHLDEIRVSARACAIDSEMLATIGLQPESDGVVLTLADRLPEGANHPEANFARLDMILNVPSRLAIEIADKREPMEISGVASLRVESGRGEITIDGVAGDTEVRTERGDLTIQNIGGNLTLARDFGEMIVRNVRGDVIIESADRGNSNISNVGGSVRVIRNGRGNIAATRVQGDFIVEANQAGRFFHQDIGGRVQLAAPSGLPEEEDDDEDDNGKGPPHLRQ